MTVDNVNAIISRAAMDPDFRRGFFTNFDQAIAGYELTEQEKGILRTLTEARLNTMVVKLQEWGEPPGAASLELLRFLFGEKAGQVIQQKQKSRASRKRMLIAVGAVALLVLIAVGAMLILGGLSGSGQESGPPQGDGGGGGACPCTCVEEDRGGVVINVCTDCNDSRCMPGE